jgi:hypothetical protein
MDLADLILESRLHPETSQNPTFQQIKRYISPEYHSETEALIEDLGETERELDRLSASGRTVSSDRAAQTIESLRALSSAENLDALADAYAALPGDGEPLPAAAFSTAVDALSRKLESLPPREETFYALGAAADYRKALCGYLGEDVLPKDLLLGLETLAQTAAYALQDALNADPEAARKKEPLTFGSLDRDLAFYHCIPSIYGA